MGGGGCTPGSTVGHPGWSPQDEHEAIPWRDRLALCGDFKVTYIKTKVHVSKNVGLDLRGSQLGIIYSLKPKAAGPAI